MKLPFFLSVFLLLIQLSLFSQEYSYTHYDISDGLAGSTVYCITQDKDGFIWVGTETGVSRFDGTHFSNYTTADGLPDIEVLQMFGDSKGRVWMAPFRKSVCYYYKGSIYNQDNDMLLRTLHVKGNIENFAEDASGNILLQEKTALHLIGSDGSVRQYDSIGGEPIHGCEAISRNISGHFQVQAGQKIFNLSDKGFSYSCTITLFDFHPDYIAMNPQWVVYREKAKRSALRSLINGQVLYHSFDSVGYKHISYSLVDDSLAYFNETVGTTEYNLHSGLTRIFLPGRQVSRTFRDMSGNLWFTTLGQGIYRLNSDEFRTIQLPASSVLQTSVYAIAKIGNVLWVGNDHDYLFKLSLPDHAIIDKTPPIVDGKNRVLFIEAEKNGNVNTLSDIGIREMNIHFHSLRGIILGIKAVFKKNDHEYLVSTNWGAVAFDTKRFSITDTLWHERSTAVYCQGDTTYIGTLNGLYYISPDKSIVFMGKNIPFLRKRISAIEASADHTLWIAFYDDAGIIAVRHDRVVARITKKQGLTSDICRVLYIDGAILWVGTDKGLNKVELDKPGYPVTRYTSNDGLGSDIINSIYVDGSTVYAGTVTGLSYFDEARIKPAEVCLLRLLAVINGGIDKIRDTGRMTLSYKASDIRFEFAGISYRSVGNITYKYRLKGLDDAWKTTKDTYLEYPTLPSGTYEFQLQAINKYDVASRILSLPFTVSTPFWRTWWFSVSMAAIAIFLIWVIVDRRIRMIRLEQQRKSQLTLRIGELENRALQAQMNPHFIFNCLNSIQQFIFDQDIFASNKFISGFARLIRATLQNSTKSFISLTDEVDYLSTYLSLEKMRFKEKMDYVIEIDPAIDRNNCVLPPMLIQPYVENSMRHGLRHKDKGKGYIKVVIRRYGQRLVVIIEDNGIGRQKAAEYKTAEHIEYQSKGMRLTADRIRAISTVYGDDIRVGVEDILTGDGQAGGTRVTLNMPEFWHGRPD